MTISIVCGRTASAASSTIWLKLSLVLLHLRAGVAATVGGSAVVAAITSVE